jgi:hypothetical protein
MSALPQQTDVRRARSRSPLRAISGHISCYSKKKKPRLGERGFLRGSGYGAITVAPSAGSLVPSLGLFVASRTCRHRLHHVVEVKAAGLLARGKVLEALYPLRDIGRYRCDNKRVFHPPALITHRQRGRARENRVGGRAFARRRYASHLLPKPRILTVRLPRAQQRNCQISPRIPLYQRLWRESLMWLKSTG